MAIRITHAYQSTLDGPPKPITRYHYAAGEFAAMRKTVERHTCFTCDKHAYGNARILTAVPTYAPYAVEPDINYYCQDCIDRGRDSEDTLYCEGCNRQVYYDHNYVDGGGWRRDPESTYDCDFICAACYQTSIINNGYTLVSLEDNHIRFDHFDHYELIAEGWTLTFKTGYLTDKEINFTRRNAIKLAQQTETPIITTERYGRVSVYHKLGE